jgi:threonine dehydrogenase-like Zn-dependent dehydrogenase
MPPQIARIVIGHQPGALALTEPEAGVRLQGGLAPVGRFLLQLIDLVWNGTIDPGKVFDLALPLDQVSEGYQAMDKRRAIKALLWP